MPQSPAAVEVVGVDKTFRVPKQHVMTLKERALHPFRRIEVSHLRALADVSFSIRPGEFYGIVGRNGSGKSTLLKCLAGIYRPDSGSIKVAGRLAPFIELGVGFNANLTAYDNVVINGVMTGLSPREARARFDEVMAFAELEDYLDLKLKNYSSGMQVRLAFSVMVQSDADVLLIDEVLAVGDAAFQAKCFDVFHRLRDEGRTIVFVTHDMHMVERFCHRALMLEEGRVEKIGDPVEVSRRYLTVNFEHRDAAEVSGPPPVTVIIASLKDESGVDVAEIPHGRPLSLHATLEVHEDLADAEIELSLAHEDTRLVRAVHREERLRAGERVEVAASVDGVLGAGHYFIGVEVRGAGRLGQREADVQRAGNFIIYGGPEDAGLLVLDHAIELRRELTEVPR
jgi:ABC-type polysaccharide/polyol phosphate transport system ATPase subunit